MDSTRPKNVALIHSVVPEKTMSTDGQRTTDSHVITVALQKPELKKTLIL